MLQNITSLRKSTPGPPNISDEHVSCHVLRLPRKMYLRRSSSNVLHLPSFLEMLQNLHVLLTFDTVHNPLRLPRETTSERPKVVRTCGVFNILTSKRASRHNGVTFWTSQVPKVLWMWCVLDILTSKCASGHNGVHYFDISTSKKWFNLVCFTHFDFEMGFAPQRRALFRHLNFQRWSENGSFCAFYFQMCFAPQRRAGFHLSSGQMALHPPL